MCKTRSDGYLASLPSLQQEEFRENRLGHDAGNNGGLLAVITGRDGAIDWSQVGLVLSGHDSREWSKFDRVNGVNEWSIRP